MHIGLLRLHIELTKCTNLLEETLNLSVCVAMVTDSVVRSPVLSSVTETAMMVVVGVVSEQVLVVGRFVNFGATSGKYGKFKITVWSNPFYRFKNLPVNNQYSFLYLSRPDLTFFYISLDTVGSLAEVSTRCPVIGCSNRRGRGKNLHVIPGSRPHPLLVRHHITWGSIPTMKSRNRNY